MLRVMKMFGKPTNKDNSKPSNSNNTNDGSSKKKSILIPMIGIALIVAVGYGGIYLFNQYSSPESSSETSLTAEETEDVIKKIGELIELPTGEVPILATVTDINSLSSEPFYDTAENGDRVLIYKSSKTAYLYRPGINKIIKVGTVTIDEAPEVAGTESGELSDEGSIEIVNIAIFNGTKVSGLAGSTGEDLENKFENIKVVDTGNASEDYSKTLIIDISGNNESEAEGLVKELGGELGSLPSEETAPSGVDILIILGE